MPGPCVSSRGTASYPINQIGCDRPTGPDDDVLMGSVIISGQTVEFSRVLNLKPYSTRCLSTVLQLGLVVDRLNLLFS